MKKTTKKKTTKKNKKVQQLDIFTEVIGLILIGLALLILVSLFTNKVGFVGEGIRILFLGFFGIGGYVIALYTIVIGVFYAKGHIKKIIISLGYMLPLILICMILFHLLTYGGNTNISDRKSVV